MKLNGIIKALCCAALASAPGMAMAQQDSSAVKKYFDAKDYLLQDRYVPEGIKFDRKAKGRNFSIGGFVGMSKLQGAGSVSPVLNEFGIFTVKDVGSFNSFRLSLTGGKNIALGRMGAELDHIFRITDYLRGWDVDRNFYIETVWGAGTYGVIPKDEKMKFAWGLHGGLILTRRLSSKLDFYIEPRLNVYSDMIDGHDIPRNYDIGFQAMAGLRYRLTPYKYTQYPNMDLLDNFFYEMYAGTSGDFNSRVWDYMGMKTLGPTAGIAIGKWVYPLGIKGTLYGGWRYTPNDRRMAISEEPYLGLRLEGMVNLNTFFLREITDPRFELNLTGGYQIGYLAHKGTGVYKKKIKLYHGPTLALQALYFVRPDLGLFVQARWGEEKYNQDMMDNSIEKRVMRNLGLELGVQYRRRYETIEKKKSRYAFSPYNFVSAQIGTNFPLHTAGVTKGVFLNELGQQFSISYGRRYSRVAAVRGTLEAGRYGYDNEKGTYPLTLAGDFMIDALSLAGGYNPERLVGVMPFLGLVFTHNELCEENNFGVQGGVNLQFRVNDEWCILGEGGLRLYKGQITPSSRVYTTARFSFVPNISVGAAYRF